MSKNYTKTRKTLIPTVSQKKNVQSKAPFLDRLENHLKKRRVWYIISCLFFATLFALLLFNVKVSEGADDSMYIQAGYDYSKGFFSYYYTFTAPLYCMFLALPIAIFGVDLIILKLFSVLFFVLGIYLVYLAFKDRIPYSVLFPALFLTAFNTQYLYHASLTYTETFTLMVMGLFFMAWFRLDDKTMLGASLRSQWQNYILLGFVIFIYYLTRNVAIASIGVVLIYFLLYRKYLTAVVSVGVFGLFYGLYNKIILPFAWKGVNTNALATQSRVMFQKDAYNPGLGQEDLSGFITRFFENAKIYSSQLMDMVGLKSATAPQSYIYFAILLGLMIIGVVFAIRKKHRVIVAAALFCVGLLGATFISLHTSWGQLRLIMIYIPFIAIVIFYGFWMVLKMKPLRMFQWLFPLLMIILLVINLGMVLKEAEKNRLVLSKNLKGNKYYGYTPDWINYFLMSEYAAANTPDSTKIGCRKTSMSFVYSGCDRFARVFPSTMVIDSALKSEKYQHEFFVTKPFFLYPQYEKDVRKYMKYLIVADNIYYVFDLPKEEKERITPILAYISIATFSSPDSIKAEIAASKSAYAADLIAMSNYLINNNIEYVIDASLRTNPAMKTTQVIGTINRYLSFLKHKYLEYYEKVHQQASDDNEPAWLYKVDLNKIRAGLGDHNWADNLDVLNIETTEHDEE